MEFSCCNHLNVMVNSRSLSMKSFLLLCVVWYTSASFQLLGSDGRFVSQIQLSRALPVEIDRTINVLDCTIDDKDIFVNTILGTSFKDRQGLSLDMKSDSSVLYSSTESLLPSQINTLIEFYISLSGKLVLLLDANQIESSLDGYEQYIRKIVHLGHIRAQKDELTHVDVICKGSDFDAVEVEDVVKKRFQSLWSTLHSTKFEKDLTLNVVTTSSHDGQNLAKKLLTPTTILKSDQTLKTSQFIVDKWNHVVQFPTYSQSIEYQQSVGDVEVAFTKNLISANVVLNQWQQRISSGKTVTAFGQRVNALLTEIQQSFQSSTSGGSAVKERSERLKSLNVHIVSVATQLQRQQLNNLMQEMEQKFKHALLKLLKSKTFSKVEDRKVEEDKLLRKFLFDFKANCDALDNDWITSISESQQHKLSDSLQLMLREFPESSSYKLLEHLKELRNAQKSLHKQKINDENTNKESGKKKWRLPLLSGFGINLVGMLRPPGHGNLQGIIGYSLKHFGWPVDLLLGVHNDGETMEVMGEDREYPLLRLQPKLNFNIDL